MVELFQVCTHAAGNLHFVKFETSKIGQCLDFIKSKNLHHCPDNGQGKKPQMRVQATGGGAFKYADMFQVTTSLDQLCILEPPAFLTHSVHYVCYMSRVALV